MSLHPQLVEALHLLDSPECCRVNERPPQLTESILRILDDKGLIEVCWWEHREKVMRPLENPSPNPDDYIFVPHWFSPQRNRGEVAKVGEDQWTAVLNGSRYAAGKSPGLRLTPAGKAALAEAALVPSADLKAPPNATPTETLTGEAKALALLVQHDGWTDTQIAAAVPCSRQTLYKWPRFKAARAAQKSGKENLPTGRKDAETGNLDAWANENG